MKLFTVLFLLLSLNAHCRYVSLQELLAKFQDEMQLSIVYDDTVTDSWNAVDYRISGDSLALKNYIDVLYTEYSKYPKNYFQLCGITTIIVAEQLRFDKERRSAVPDPYLHTLYFSIDGQYHSADPVYLVHVMHHELNHCTEYAMWKNMYYKWGKWKRTNKLCFKYLGVGHDAYSKPEINWYEMTHPQKGFINLYSTTGQEEDRSELIALMMTDQERDFIFQYSKHDRILRKKIRLLQKQLSSFCKTTDNYWEKHVQI